MKRFLGWVVAGVGVVGTCWAGYYVMTGQSKAVLHPLPVNAMVGGLAGVGMLTMGLLWARD